MAHAEVIDRSEDVKTKEDATFDTLNLSDKVVAGLKKAGFTKPSPIQLEAIPLGRCGLDLVIQSKAGTGKTLVFAVVALGSIDLESKGVQVIIIAPTREIAFQNAHVIHTVGSHVEGLQVQVFIGGLSTDADQSKAKSCNVAVGTPGRLRQMIENKALDCRFTTFFVLDEADKLMEESFLDDITWIFTQLPVNKQVMAVSATYPKALEDLVTRYMKTPSFVRIEHTRPALLSLRQFACRVPYHPVAQQLAKRKFEALLAILKSVQFDQCIIFTNLQTRAETLAAQLTTNGFAALCIVGSQNQTRRLQTLLQLRQHQCRILVATDLAARGIDSEFVNLVIQVDTPRDFATHLHRVGRAGRFGSTAAAVNILSEGNELTEFRHIIGRTKSLVKVLPPLNDLKNSGNEDQVLQLDTLNQLWDQLETLEGSGAIETDVDTGLSSSLAAALQPRNREKPRTSRNNNRKKETLAKCEEIRHRLPTAEPSDSTEKNYILSSDLYPTQDNSQNNLLLDQQCGATWSGWYQNWASYIDQNKVAIEADVYQETLCFYLNKL